MKLSPSSNNISDPFVGIDIAMSNEEYHLHPAIGSSGIRAFLETPKTYHYHYIENPGHKSPTSSQELGSAAHCYVLEPDIFDSHYIVASEEATDRRVKAWKMTEKRAKDLGKIPILHKDFVRLQNMRKELMKHRLIRGIFTSSECKFEMSAFCLDQQTGLHLKARPDIYLDDIIVDYKTGGVNIGATSYSRHEYNLGRHIQGWHHKNVTELATGIPIHKVLHIVQQIEAPYLVRVFNMGAEWLDLGKRMTNMALLEMAECKRTGHYPGYSEDSIEDLIMPNWAGTEIN